MLMMRPPMMMWTPMMHLPQGMHLPQRMPMLPSWAHHATTHAMHHPTDHTATHATQHATSHPTHHPTTRATTSTTTRATTHLTTHPTTLATTRVTTHPTPDHRWQDWTWCHQWPWDQHHRWPEWNWQRRWPSVTTRFWEPWNRFGQYATPWLNPYAMTDYGPSAPVVSSFSGGGGYPGDYGSYGMNPYGASGPTTYVFIINVHDPYARSVYEMLLRQAREGTQRDQPTASGQAPQAPGSVRGQ
jgi:hypothetical protein